jgi:Ca2+-binding RTX toxin-like protein
MAIVVGTSGNDLLKGTATDDTIFANAGPDSGPVDGKDVVFAGGGNDVIYGADGNDILFGGAGDDMMFGGTGDDKLFGGAGNDSVYGVLGSDTVLGGGGDDRVFGSDGDDKIDGGDGNDTMFGDTGADLFVFKTGDGDDVINDLNFAEGDRLLLPGFGLGTGTFIESVGEVRDLNDAGKLNVSVGVDDLTLEFATGQTLILRGLAEEYSLLA